MRANRLIGRQVAGRFTIKRFLGEGGMATVFVAEQAGEPREVALKIMNEDLTADRSFVKRFQREAKAAARVQHPNSVTLIDYGVAEGLSYIAMELLAGEDLYVLLERDGAITQARAARIVVEVCDALMVAHELGIVHRDLKPENIMVIPDPSAPNGERVKVLDFGIAKILAPDAVAPPDPRLDPSSGVTRAGTFIGTPAYMSPEQCALLAVDTRADIYTCGVLLFQLVTGRLPFEGQTPLHTATLHIHEPAPKPSSFAPNIDPRLESVIMKALAKKPTERHQTARHLASTLRKILPDMPDVRVARVGKPAPGALRPRGSTRNSAAVPPPQSRPPASSDPGMESAKTMVQTTGGAAPAAPSVVLRNDGSADPSADSTPARIRPAPPLPAAGRPAEPAKPDIIPRVPEDDDDDSDDSMRTLVRAPAEEGAPAPGMAPQITEVIMPSVAHAALSAALGAPPAPPPPVEMGSPGGVPQTPPPEDPSEAPTDNGAAAKPPPAPPRPAPPRLIKQTLKSAGDFKPEVGKPVPPVVVRDAPPVRKGPPDPDSGDSSVTPIVALFGGSPKPPGSAVPPPTPVLGALKLGAVQLKAAEADEDTSTPRAKGGDRPSPIPPTEGDGPPASIQVVVSAAAFAETAKVEVADPSKLGVRDGGMLGIAATVPLISPSTVAAAIALGPSKRPGGTTMPVLIPPVSPAAPKPPMGDASRPGEPVPTLHEASAPPAPAVVQAPPAGSVGVSGTMPISPDLVPTGPLAPPPTPPIFPLGPVPEASPISGTRGLLVGFLAGALLMGLVALVYFAFGR